MVKDILIGLSVGAVAGMFVARNSKSVGETVDNISSATQKKMKEMKPKQSAKKTTKTTKSVS